MKIITAVVIAQLFLLVAGNDSPRANKRAGCWYFGGNKVGDLMLNPEDIDISHCTHLEHQGGTVDDETEDLEIKFIGDAGLTPRLAKLKEKNPDLKLILQIDAALTWISENPSRKEKVIKNGLDWLKNNGFDGLSFPTISEMAHTEEIADFFCDLKSEVDKSGFTLSTVILDDLSSEASETEMESFSKLVRCCDNILLTTSIQVETTDRLAALKGTKSSVDLFMERGLPLNKVLIGAAGVGTIYTLEDPLETGPGAKVSAPGFDDDGPGMGYLINYGELWNKLSNSSYGWTFHRDEETEEPYAFTSTGLWASYEDTASAESKARYVLEKGLGGMDIIVAVQYDYDEGNGNEGRFPLMRTIYNAIRQGNQPADNSNRGN